MPAEPHDDHSQGADDAVTSRELTAVEQRLDQRLREEMARANEAMAALSRELNASLAPSTIYGQRLVRLLSRRLQEVEGAVAVAMALADRTGVELRAELHAVAEDLAVQLESFAATAHATPTALENVHDLHALEVRFDEVHRRIDAVTRELHTVSRTGQPLPGPYGERLARTLGRRLEHVEGAVAVSSALAERVDADLRQELSEAAAAGQRQTEEVLEAIAHLAGRLERVEDDQSLTNVAGLAEALRRELRAFEAHVGEELVTLSSAARVGADADRAAELRLGELSTRVEEAERDRDVLNARFVRAQESWSSERAALQERVSELAARIVTGPIPERANTGDARDWVFARGYDQLRIAVEGLRMRLAYHEKAVAELASERGVDERMVSMHQLLGRLETAELSVRGERDSVQDQLERISARLDWRLAQLETSAAGPED